MSWKSIACIAALGALAAPAMALPSISVVDNGGGVGSINITTTATGSIGAEVALQLSGATLTGATVNSAIFDTANPGDSPFIPGSPVGGDANGLVLGLAQNRLFASFGSGSQPAGTYKLLDFNFTGTGTATATGLAASIGVTTSGLTSGAVPITVGGGPLPGDANGDNNVDLLDLAILGQNFGQSPRTFAQGNFNTPQDTIVDLLDLAILGENFGTSAALAAAVPEPTSVAVLGLGLVAVAARRRF